MKSKDLFVQCLILSLGVHFICMLISFQQVKFRPNDEILLSSSMKVDIVDLPDKKKSESKAQKKKLTKEKKKKLTKKKKKVKKPKVPPKPKKVVVSKKEVSKKEKAQVEDARAQKSALDQLKQASAFEDLEKKVVPKEKVKGNLINEGVGLEGLDRVQFNDYYRTFKEHLYSHWKIPKWLEGKNYRAVAIVRIDQGGNLVVKLLVEGSGNDVFDESILSAIEQSEPFPAPPESIRAIISRQTFKLGFPKIEE